MTKLNLIVLATLIALPLAACNKSSGDEEGSAAGEESARSEGGEGEEAPAGGPMAIPQFGLNIDVPAGATISDAVGGGVMIRARGLVVTVKEPGRFTPATLEAAQSEAEMYSPQNIQTETLADGWALTFENTGSAGANYFVQVRREIGGTAYWCETTAAQRSQQANALEACKSLSQ